MAQLPLSVIQEAIELLKSLDPPGIGANNIKDCLLLQLHRKGLSKSLAADIIRKQWDLLLRRRIPEIARALRVKPTEVELAIEAELGRHPIYSRGIEPVAENLRHHKHIGISLEAGGNRPQNVLFIKYVYIVIYSYSQFDIGIQAKEQHQGVSSLALGCLL